MILSMRNIVERSEQANIEIWPILAHRFFNDEFMLKI